jgi:hypothetical protein
MSELQQIHPEQIPLNGADIEEDNDQLNPTPLGHRSDVHHSVNEFGKVFYSRFSLQK